MRFDFSECTNERSKQNLIRDHLNAIIYNALVNEFGVDNVAHIDEDFYTEDGAKFSKNTVVAKVDEIENKDGFTVDILIECGTKVRTWNTSGKRVAVSFDDIAEHYAKEEDGE